MDIVKFSQTVSILSSRNKNLLVEFKNNGAVTRGRFVELDLSALKEGFLAIVEQEGRQVRVNVINDVVAVRPV